MDNKLFEFKVVIFFKDGTSTNVTTYDDNAECNNTITIEEGCYSVSLVGTDLIFTGKTLYPIENNIKEITTTRKEITND